MNLIGKMPKRESYSKQIFVMCPTQTQTMTICKQCVRKSRKVAPEQAPLLHLTTEAKLPTVAR